MRKSYSKICNRSRHLIVLRSWVVGALDSAWRAVYNYLFYTDPSKLPKFFELWGRNAEWFEEPGRQAPKGPGNFPGKMPKDGKSYSLLESYLRKTQGVDLAHEFAA